MRLHSTFVRSITSFAAVATLLSGLNSPAYATPPEAPADIVATPPLKAGGPDLPPAVERTTTTSAPAPQHYERPVAASVSRPAPIPRAANAAAAAAKEGWTPYSHWTRNADGSRTTTISAAPSYTRRGQTWRPIDETVRPTGDDELPFAAEGAVRPLRFGGHAGRLLELGLDRGAVTVSSADLKIDSAPRGSARSVVYRDVAPMTDLRFEVGPEGTRQIMVLNGPEAPRRFTFHISDPHGALGDVVSDGNDAYHFTAAQDGLHLHLESPFAQEVRGRDGRTAAVSAHQTVTRAGDGFDVTEWVDEDWLRGKTFPIELDPNYSLRLDGVTDCTITSGTQANTTSCSSSNGQIGYSSSSPYAHRYLVQFPTDAVPYGSTINSATLKLYVESVSGTQAGTTVEVRQPGHWWGTATWNHADVSTTPDTPWGSPTNLPGGAQGSTAYDAHSIGPAAGWATWNVLAITRRNFSWDPIGKTDGYLVRASSESGPSMPVVRTANEVNTAYRPLLTINAYPPPDLDVNPGDGTVNVFWTKVPDESPSKLTGYLVTPHKGVDNSMLPTIDVAANAGSATVAEVDVALANDQPYYFKVQAKYGTTLGPASWTRHVTPRLVPEVSAPTLVAGSSPLASGATGRFRFTVKNRAPATTLNYVSFTLPSGWQGDYPSLRIDDQDCAAIATSCTFTGGTVSFYLNMTAGQTRAMTMSFQALTPARQCTPVTLAKSSIVAINADDSVNSNIRGYAAADLTVSTCDAGLGREHWWSMVSKDVAERGTAAVNVGNGNLVLQQEDSTPFQATGQLALSVRRTYNSQDTRLVSLPGNIGAGWTLSVGSVSDVAGAITPAGLNVPSLAAQLTGPANLMLIDRDGTRHQFKPTALAPAVSTPLAPGTSPLTGALSTLTPRNSAILPNDYTNICVDQSYSAPAGVHLGVWRYIAVATTNQTTPCNAAVWSAAPAPVTVGFAAVRPDRLRTEFDATGRVTSMTDAFGNELVYEYAAVAGHAGTTWLSRVHDPLVPGREIKLLWSANRLEVTDPAGRVTTYHFSADPLVLQSLDNPVALTSHLVKVENPDGGSLTYEYEDVIPSGGATAASCGNNSAGANDAATGQLCKATDARGNAFSVTYQSGPGLPRVDMTTDRRGIKTEYSYVEPSGTVSDHVTVDTNPDYQATDNAASGRRTKYDFLDSAGRAGTIYAGYVTNAWSRIERYQWDSATYTCTLPTAKPDNNLCEVGIPISSASAGAPANTTRYKYLTATGDSAVEETVLSTTSSLFTTHGFQVLTARGDGTTLCTTATPTGSGAVSVTNATTTGCANTAGTALYAISDRTLLLPASGNAVGAAYAAYQTRYKRDAKPGAATNARPSDLPVCSHSDAPTTSTGALCETDGPVYAGTSARAITCATYDAYGRKVTETPPLAIPVSSATTCDDAADPGRTGLDHYSYTYYEATPTTNPQDLSLSTRTDGWLKAVTDPDDAFAAFAYDRAGNVQLTWDRNADKGSATAAGFVAERTSPGFSETDFTRIDGKPWRHVLRSADALGNTTRYGVDRNGNPVTITPPRGAATDTSYDVTQVFDGDGNLTSRLLPEERATRSSDGADHPMTWTYDAYGNAVLVRIPRTSSSDEDAYAAARFDAANRVTETWTSRSRDGNDDASTGCLTVSSTVTAGAIPAGKVACGTTRSYSLNGQLDDESGSVRTHYVYDLAGRRTQQHVERVGDGNPARWLYTVWTLDPDGRQVDACRPNQFLAAASGGGGSSTTTLACAATAPYASHATYNAAGLLTKLRTYRSATDPNDTTYEHDAMGNVKSETSPRSNETATPWATTATYDVQGRKTAVAVPRTIGTTHTTAFEYDKAGNTTFVTAPGGEITAYTYDLAGRPRDTILGLTSKASVKTALPGHEGGTNVRTRLAYDADGNVTDTYGPRAFVGAPTVGGELVPDARHKRHTAYDRDGRPLVDYVPRWDGDQASRLGAPGDDAASTQCPAPPEATGYPSGVGACRTQYGYDYAGNRTIVVLPTSKNVVTNPSGDARPAAGADGSDGRYVLTSFADDGLVARISTPSPTAAATTLANRASSDTTYRYDAEQRVISVNAPLSRSTTRAYTTDGLLFTESRTGYTGPDGVAVTHTTKHSYDDDGNEKTVWDALNQMSTRTYTADGLLSTSRDPLLSETQITYDANGNVATRKAPTAVALQTSNPQGTAAAFSYTLDDLLATEDQPYKVPAAPGAVTYRRMQYSYDGSGRTTAEALSEVTGAATVSGGTASYTWFGNGRLARETGRDGATIAHRYDADGNEVLTAYLATGGDPAESPQCPAGQTCAARVTCDATTVCGTYYLDGAVRSVSGGARTGGSDTTAYGYDAAGEMTSRTFGPGSTVEQTDSFVYSDAGRLMSTASSVVTGQSPAWTWAYDEAGRRTSTVRPDGATVTRVVNPDDTVRSETTTDGNAATQVKYEYTYDNESRQKTQQVTAGGSVTSNAYTYDLAGRVSKVTTGAVARDVLWNRDGSRLCYGANCVASGTAKQLWTYNADGSLASESDTSGGNVKNVSYDQSGRITTDGTRTYCHDGFDRLTAVAAAPATCAALPASATTYAYDGLDRQVSRAVDGVTTAISYEGRSSRPLVQASTSTSSGHRIVLDPSGEALATVPLASTTPEIHGDDGHGSVTTSTSGSTLACLASYDPFGTTQNANSGGVCTSGVGTGTTSNDLLYRGERRDSATGNYQLGSRTYDPAKASFLTADRFRGAPSAMKVRQAVDPLTANTYNYVNGDPVNYADPSGHCRVEPNDDKPRTHPFEAWGCDENRNAGRDRNDAYQMAIHNVPSQAGACELFVNILSGCAPPPEPTELPPPEPQSETKRSEDSGLFCKVTGVLGWVATADTIVTSVQTQNAELGAYGAATGSAGAVTMVVKKNAKSGLVKKVAGTVSGLGFVTDALYLVGGCADGLSSLVKSTPPPPIPVSRCREAYNRGQSSRSFVDFWQDFPHQRSSGRGSYSTDLGCGPGYTYTPIP